MDVGCLNKRTKVFQSQEMFDTFDYFTYTDPYFFFNLRIFLHGQFQPINETSNPATKLRLFLIAWFITYIINKILNNSYIFVLFQ